MTIGRALSFTLLLCMCTLCYANSPLAPRHGATEPQLKQYVESGAYIKEIEHQVLEGKNYLDRRLKNRSHERFAIVFDIDETALSNYRTLEENHFSNDLQVFTTCYLLGAPEAIGPILGLYQYAKNRGIEVFFVGSRPNNLLVMDATIRNLKQAGYDGWKELYLKPLDQVMSLSAFKRLKRQHIVDQGYTIVLNIGDQTSDLEGGLSETALKLPNPFYQENSLHS